MSKLFELITEFIEITGNSTVDAVLLWVIAIISFLIAFGLVGIIFDSFGLYDSDLMSDCHWFIRLLVFLGLSAICISIAKFITWLFSLQWWIYVLMFIIIIGAGVLIHYFKHKHSTKKSKIDKKDVIEIKESAIKVENIQIDLRELCPRCRGKLVKRHGPYGDFYGCENFSIKDCRYTRKFK